MRHYLDTLKHIMDHGHDREGRNGFTRSLFGLQMRFNLEDGFPATTTKKLAFKAVKGELLWFIEGSSDDNRLKELMGSDKTIWTANAQSDYWRDKAAFEGDLGRIYGVQWRYWRSPENKEIDQLRQIIDRIQTNPYDRRLIVSAWNPGEIEQMALPPCHVLYQFYVHDKKLSLHMYQRSCDMFLGVPFNIASYSLLLSMIAQVTNLEPYEFVHTLGDAHIYHDHFDQVHEQLSRTPLALPQLWLNPDITSIDDFTMDDIRLENYEHQGLIKAEMAV